VASKKGIIAGTIGVGLAIIGGTAASRIIRRRNMTAAQRILNTPKFVGDLVTKAIPTNVAREILVKQFESVDRNRERRARIVAKQTFVNTFPLGKTLGGVFSFLA